MSSIWSAARLRSDAKTDANNAEEMAEGENRRKRRNAHFINQIRISENDGIVTWIARGVSQRGCATKCGQGSMSLLGERLRIIDGAGVGRRTRQLRFKLFDSRKASL